MPYKLIIEGFVQPRSLRSATITLDGVDYTVTLEEHEGIEDLVAKFEQAIGLQPPISSTGPDVYTFSYLTLSIMQLEGTPTVSFTQDGTEPFTEEPMVSEIVDLAQVDGIFAARGRLGAWDEDNALYWSSYNDVLDFEPSLATQANVLQADAVRGKIIKVSSWPEGFVIHSTDNTVVARYSGDQFVFDFKFLSNKGITDPRHVAAFDNVIFGWDVTGLYSIYPQQMEVQPLAPELTDLLNTKDLPIKLAMLGDRYLAIMHASGLLSYDESLRRDGSAWGPVDGAFPQPALPQEVSINRFGYNIGTIHTYSAGLIYDTVLKRWGRVDTSFSMLFSLSPVNQSSYNLVQRLAKQHYTKDMSGIACIDDGMTYLFTQDNPDSFLVFGRYQLSRSGKTRLIRVTTEYAEAPAAQVHVEVASEDGRLDHSRTLSSGTISTIQHEMPCHPVGKWFNIIVKGIYHLRYLLVEGFKHGNR